MDTYQTMHPWDEKMANMLSLLPSSNDIKYMPPPNPPIDKKENENYEAEYADVQQLVITVLARAAVIHNILETRIKRITRSRRYLDGQEMLIWLERHLPMFLSVWYMPARILKGYNERIKQFEEIMKDTIQLKNLLDKAAIQVREPKPDDDIYKLANHLQKMLKEWKESKPYINAAMDQKLGELFKPKEGETGEEKKRLLGEHEEYYKALDALRRLYDRQGIQPKQRPWQY